MIGAYIILTTTLCKGAFNNYVDRFLPLFDHLPTPRRQTYTFGLPPTLCLRRHLENDHPLIEVTICTYLLLLLVMRKLYHLLSTSSKVEFTKKGFVYVDIEQTTYLPLVDKRRHLADHPPTSSCLRSY